MKSIFKPILTASFIVSSVALLLSPIILLVYNCCSKEPESIDASSFFALVIMSYFQNIIILIPLLVLGKFLYFMISKAFTYNYFVVSNLCYYLFLIFAFPIRSCLLWRQFEFYADPFSICLVVSIIIVDVVFRILWHRKSTYYAK